MPTLKSNMLKEQQEFLSRPVPERDGDYAVAWQSRRLKVHHPRYITPEDIKDMETLFALIVAQAKRRSEGVT